MGASSDECVVFVVFIVPLKLTFGLFGFWLHLLAGMRNVFWEIVNELENDFLKIIKGSGIVQ